MIVSIRIKSISIYRDGGTVGITTKVSRVEPNEEGKNIFSENVREFLIDQSYKNIFTSFPLKTENRVHLNDEEITTFKKAVSYYIEDVKRDINLLGKISDNIEW